MASKPGDTAQLNPIQCNVRASNIGLGKNIHQRFKDHGFNTGLSVPSSTICSIKPKFLCEDLNDLSISGSVSIVFAIQNMRLSERTIWTGLVPGLNRPRHFPMWPLFASIAIGIRLSLLSLSKSINLFCCTGDLPRLLIYQDLIAATS